MTLRGGPVRQFLSTGRRYRDCNNKHRHLPIEPPKGCRCNLSSFHPGTVPSGIFTATPSYNMSPSYRHTETYDLTGRCVVVIHVFLVGGPYDPIGDRNFCQLCFDGSVCPYTIKAGSPFRARQIPWCRSISVGRVAFPIVATNLPVIVGIGAMDVVFPSVRFTRMISFCKATTTVLSVSVLR